MASGKRQASQFTRAETTHLASGKRQASQHRFTKIGVSAREGSDDDDVYYYMRWRLKLEGETENMGVWK